MSTGPTQGATRGSPGASTLSPSLMDALRLSAMLVSGAWRWVVNRADTRGNQGVTTGKYTVALPDGRTQIVSYVGKWGL